MNIVGTSLSGMAAAQARLNVSASNVANAANTGAPTQDPGTSSAAPRPYRPLVLVQVSLVDGGVATEARASAQGTISAYEPCAPGADANGQIGAPDVDLADEAVSQIQALQQFKASVQIFKTEEEMQKTTLNLTT